MKMFIVVFMTLLIIPICVEAGVICNDGWESSCDFSRPGCCSHHGGVAEDGYYVEENYVKDDYSSSNNDSIVVWFLIIIFFGLPYGCWAFEEVSKKIKLNKRQKTQNKKNNKKKENRKKKNYKYF